MYYPGSARPQVPHPHGFSPMHMRPSAHFVQPPPPASSGRCIPNWLRVLLFIGCAYILFESTRTQDLTFAPVDHFPKTRPTNTNEETSGNIFEIEGSKENVNAESGASGGSETPLAPIPGPTAEPTPTPAPHKYFVVLGSRKEPVVCGNKQCGNGTCAIRDNAPMCVCADGTAQVGPCADCAPGFALETDANSTKPPTCVKCQDNTISVDGKKCVKCQDGKFANIDHTECEEVDLEVVAAFEANSGGAANEWWWWVILVIVLMICFVTAVTMCLRKKKYSGDGSFEQFQNDYSTEEVSITEPSIFIPSDAEIMSNQILGDDSGSDIAESGNDNFMIEI